MLCNGLHKRGRSFCQNVRRKKIEPPDFENDAMKNDSKKSLWQKTVTSSCAFPAQDCPKNQSKWQPLGHSFCVGATQAESEFPPE
jgi:hypothetical protein